MKKPIFIKGGGHGSGAPHPQPFLQLGRLERDSLGELWSQPAGS